MRRLVLLAATLLAVGAALAGTTSSIKLFLCRNPQCDSLVNCAGKASQDAKCGAGHKFRCPPPPGGPGEHVGQHPVQGGR